MVLPLYLAMTGAEICAISHPAYLMEDLSDLPPPGFLPVVTDRFPIDGQALHRFCQGRETVVLDFERPPTPAMRAAVQGLPCPVAAPPEYPDRGPVFLPLPPLHVPLAQYLAPWQGREIWLEAALQKQTITVTASGAVISAPSPAAGLSGGFYDRNLHCRFAQEIRPDRVMFTLFDTPETLKEKLDLAATLGVTRAIGLYQELGSKL